MLGRVQLFATLWTIVFQIPLSIKFPRQEYLSGLPFSSPGDLPDPGIKPTSLKSPALANGFCAAWEAPIRVSHYKQEQVDQREQVESTPALPEASLKKSNCLHSHQPPRKRLGEGAGSQE